MTNYAELAIKQATFAQRGGTGRLHGTSMAMQLNDVFAKWNAEDELAAQEHSCEEE